MELADLDGCYHHHVSPFFAAAAASASSANYPIHPTSNTCPTTDDYIPDKISMNRAKSGLPNCHT
jgi:hypothetical protein